MASGTTVGFFPAASGARTAAATSAGPSDAAADSPFGLFEALLHLASIAGGGKAAGQGQPPTVALGALFEHLTSAAPDSAVTAPTAVDSDSKGLPADLLAELSQILDALGIAGDGDGPLDQSLEQQATAVVEAIAGATGIPLPVVKGGEAAARALAALATDATPANVDAPAPATAETSGDDNPDVARIREALAEKLARLASTIESKGPALAERLAALGGAISSGDLDDAIRAALRTPPSQPTTGDTLDPAILRLLSPATATSDTKGAVGTKPFSDPTLAVPSVLTADQKASVPGSGAGTEDRDDVHLKPESRIANGPSGADRPAAASHPSPQGQVGASPSADSTQDQARAQIQSVANGVPSATTGTVHAEARAVHAAYSAPVQQINIPQVAFEITRQIQAGATRFQIRLDPPELGRIDVKLDLDSAGNIHARMTVDRAETLDLMQRDHRVLERALVQAGLDGSKTNLEFSLRQNPFAHQEQQQHRGGNTHQPWTPVSAEADAPASLPPPQVIAYRGAASPGGVNLFV